MPRLENVVVLPFHSSTGLIEAMQHLATIICSEFSDTLAKNPPSGPGIDGTGWVLGWTKVLLKCAHSSITPGKSSTAAFDTLLIEVYKPVERQLSYGATRPAGFNRFLPLIWTISTPRLKGTHLPSSTALVFRLVNLYWNRVHLQRLFYALYRRGPTVETHHRHNHGDHLLEGGTIVPRYDADLVPGGERHDGETVCNFGGDVAFVQRLWTTSLPATSGDAFPPLLRTATAATGSPLVLHLPVFVHNEHKSQSPGSMRRSRQRDHVMNPSHTTEQYPRHDHGALEPLRDHWPFDEHDLDTDVAVTTEMYTHERTIWSARLSVKSRHHASTYNRGVRRMH